ncbi:hypothetical protein GW17_00008174, partial [Ensete ventricosum]
LNLTINYLDLLVRWLQQPQIILLKEGTDTSQGKAQVVSNINACTAVADVVRTTLGPRGMDKLIHDEKGSTTISNDGATIMKLLDVVHPAAKILVDIAKSQDSEVTHHYPLQFIDEAERSLHDAIMIVRRALKNSTIVPGGGAIDVTTCNTPLSCSIFPLLEDNHFTAFGRWS